jgi:gliding motility-associated-like protein
MSPRYALPCLILLALLGPFAPLSGYGQAATAGCTSPYYLTGFDPPGDADIYLKSVAVGPDGSVYLGSIYYPNYTIVKADTFGAIIRTTSYTPGSPLGYYANPGKTMFDYDGNLLSVITNNQILKTDTLGNILWSRQLLLSGGSSFSFIDVQVLPNGNKVFLLDAWLGGWEDVFLVETTPDVSTITWVKYLPGWNYGYASPAIAVDGNNIILGVDFYGSGYYTNGAGLLEFDAGSGTLLRQQWFPQLLNFTQVGVYNNGYIFNGMLYDGSGASFYIRTDKNLNVLAANSFPAFAGRNPIIFQPQASGSIYGSASTNINAALFYIDPNDEIQWASTFNGSILTPVALVLSPAGIYIGDYFTGDDVATGYTVSNLALYKTSYSGYFASCAGSSYTTMSMSPYSLTSTAPLVAIGDTGVFSITAGTIQAAATPGLYSIPCNGTPTCNSVRLAGNSAVCTGSGNYTGTLNTGCPLPLTWTVTGGPGTGTITTTGAGSASISFSAAGVYQVKAALSTNCSIFADSMLVHVSAATAHLSLGDDTTLCAGASLVLHAGVNFGSYSWQDGSTDSNFVVTTPGVYSVSVQDYCGNGFNASVDVLYRPPLVSPYPSSLGKCLADTLSLALPSGFDSVYFTAPAPGARIVHDSVQFFDANTYSLEAVDDYGCRVASGIIVQVYPQPVLNIGNDTAVCPGDSVLLDAGAGLDNYLWSTGSQNETVWAVAPGTYWVQTTTANGCVPRASMTLSDYPAPVTGLPPDTTLCSGSGKTIDLAAASGFVSYLWNNGSGSSSLLVDTSGLYWLRVTDAQGCSATDTVSVVEHSCLVGCYVPNAFTPIGGGRNNIFRPLIYGSVGHYRFAVFSRWGQEVFASTTPGEGWDGTVSGVLQAAGTYVWYCVYQFSGEPVQTQRGTVVLIR